MVAAEPGGRPAPKEAIVAKTADVLASGLQVFIRFKLASLDRLIPVICQGMVQPGNTLIVQWTEEAARISSLPEEGLEVQCQLLAAGVLYLTKGVVAQLGDGPLPRVRIRTSEKCLGIKLRGQQRYAVRGKLELLEPGGAVVYAHNTYQKMNLSLGGFGTRLPEAAKPKHAFTGFRLEALVESGTEPDESYPALNITGEAELRHTDASSHEGLLYAGFQFSRLDEINTGTLQFWLATHLQSLRAL